MIEDFREINRVLIAIQELSVDDYAKKNDVLNECKQVVLGGKIPNHEETISFSISSGMIIELENSLKMSLLGKKFLKANLEGIWDLNEEQNKILIENCFLEGFLKDTTIEILKQFFPDNKRQTFVLSKSDEGFILGNPKFIRSLFQIGLLQEDDKSFFINPDFSRHFSSIIKKQKMSIEELEYKMKIDKEIGDVAEKIILEYEKNRLKQESAISESSLVQIISSTDVSAGYDIESFDGKTADLEFNRHIEVKGSRRNDLSFYWSAGEIEKAKEMENSYWIYFVPGINLINQTFDGDIIKIQNPAKEIFNSGIFSSKCVKYHISKKIKSN